MFFFAISYGGAILLDSRTIVYDTSVNDLKSIQIAALFVIALNCGIIGYWFGQYKPIFKDFLTNHGAKTTNGKYNGKPRTRISFFEKYWNQSFHRYGFVFIKNDHSLY